MFIFICRNLGCGMFFFSISYSALCLSKLRMPSTQCHFYKTGACLRVCLYVCASPLIRQSFSVIPMLQMKLAYRLLLRPIRQQGHPINFTTEALRIRHAVHNASSSTLVTIPCALEDCCGAITTRETPYNNLI